MLVIRPARTSDVKAIRELVDSYAAPGQMLAKETVTLFEGVQEFSVAELDGKVIGCGALHILWEDLAEVRTVAVEKSLHKQGIGHQILQRIIERAREIGVSRIFCSPSKQISLENMDLKRLKELLFHLMSMPSSCTHMTLELQNSWILSR